MSRRRRMLVGVVAAALVAAGMQPAAATAPRAGENQRVQGAAGEPDARSYGPAITPDGRHVAFVSDARNLLDGPDEATGRQAYVADREAGTIERVSMTHDGGVIAGSASGPSISADGRFVAYHSAAADIVPGIDNFAFDVFVHDRETGSTERVSVTHEGQEVNGWSYDAALSADGRYVAYVSDGTRLVPGQAPSGAGQNVFRYDRHTGEVVQVSVAHDGGEPDGWSHEPAISADGSVVAFWSEANNLLADYDGIADVFVRDVEAGVTEQASVSTDGTRGNIYSVRPTLSADGRYVAFDSIAFNLVPEANSGANDVYVHDRATGVTERISVDSAGRERHLVSGQRNHISADGRYVVYDAAAWTLGTLLARVYLHDRLTGVTETISVAADGGDPDDSSYSPVVSADGRYVAFEGRGTNLVPGDTGDGSDVYIRDRGPHVGVGGAGATRNGDGITVAGWATFSGAVLGEATADLLLPEERTGLQLRHARVVYRPERQDLYVRLDLAGTLATPGVWDIPGQVVEARAGPPGVVYGVEFASGGVRYEVRATRSLQAQGEQAFAVYRCDPVCLAVGDAEGSIGHTGQQVRIAVPLDVLQLGEGAALDGLRSFAGLGELATGALARTTDLALGDARLPERSLTVSLYAEPDGELVATQTTGLDAAAFAVELTSQAAVSRAEATACLGEECGPAVTLVVPEP